jgi:ferredoxin
LQRLADLLGREVKALEAEEKPKAVALIDEQTCIGCTLCIQACPVDAIVGAAKQMHTIIADPVHRVRAVSAALPGRVHHHGAHCRKPRQLEVEVSGVEPSSGSPDAAAVQFQGRGQAADQQSAIGAQNRSPSCTAAVAPVHSRCTSQSAAHRDRWSARATTYSRAS